MANFVGFSFPSGSVTSVTPNFDGTATVNLANGGKATFPWDKSQDFVRFQNAAAQSVDAVVQGQ